MSDNKPTKSDKKVVDVKSWTIELITYKDGTSTLNRTNDGFNQLELLGICTKCIGEITDQAKGIIKPTTVNRNVVERK